MKKNRQILATLCLLIIVGVLLGSAAGKCYQSERQSCFQRLTEYTLQIGNQISKACSNDRSCLEGISSILARQDLTNLEDTQALLSSAKCSGMITRMDLLLPGDRLLTGTGDMIDVSGKLSYQQEADQGCHISRRCSDLLQPDSLILRHYVPVIQNGQTTAVLCGVINLDALPQMFSLTGYEDSMQLYIVEGSTGNFILDTLHDKLGSTSELGNRQTKPGYSWAQFNADIAQGIPGTMIFKSQSTGKYFYSYSAPTGVADWMVMISVPEDIAFAQAQNVLNFFYGLAALLLAAFTVYFIFILLGIRRERAADERELRNIRYMFDVEKNLFDVNTYPEHFSEALQTAADFLTAEITFYRVFGYTTDMQERLRSNRACSALEEENILSISQEIWPVLQKGSILSYDMAALKHKLPLSVEKFEEFGIHNLMLISVSDPRGKPAIILGAWNMTHHWENTSPMEMISRSFSTAIYHYNYYQALIKMGQTDNLTGLMNRNSYHLALDTLSAGTYSSLACIYLDANGLHEINNHLGHQAGDAMLKSIARVLQEFFPVDQIYRIGGDEFVIFCQNENEQDLHDRTELVRRKLKESGYELSIGVEWRDTELEINSIINSAESAMQEDKLKYYQANGKERQLRALNSKLEQMIVEKQDADTFLAVLSPEFKGVYFVDLSKDTVRHLYIPSYFETILEEVGDVFSKAILLYAQRIAKPEYDSMFRKFCDYDYLETLLNDNITPTFVYQRNDGSWLKLRVLKFKNYNAENRETLWIFSDSEAGNHE